MPFDPSTIDIIDVDTHVIEPPDLWTSRMPASTHDRIPQVRWDDLTNEECWFMGNQRLMGVGFAALAGWNQFPPDRPRRWAEIDPVMTEPDVRLRRMDEYGVRAQVLYPNVALFDAKWIHATDDRSLRLEMLRTYNDWLVDWSSSAPDRFLPITALPFWDVDTACAEAERCHDLGHRGLSMSQDPSAFGLPDLTDQYWDPLWRTAEERGLSINFHIASGDAGSVPTAAPDSGQHASFASVGVSFFLSVAKTLAGITCGGVCHRFPRLNFVLVESGIGWLPFAMDSLDWQWQNCGVTEEHPEYDLLPSEYIRRQVYGTFWFEPDPHHAIERVGVDNVMYETDFPHPTSMSPGPASVAVKPPEYLRTTFPDAEESYMRKLLHDNAARVYHLD